MYRQAHYDFGNIRVSEIIGGQEQWSDSTVTYNSFCLDKPLGEVINPQMIIDAVLNEIPGETEYITLSQSALQRIFYGKNQRDCPVTTWGGTGILFCIGIHGENRGGKNSLQ